MKRQTFSIVVSGLLVASFFQLIATGLSQNTLRTLANPAITLAQPAQAEADQVNANQLAGEYIGQVKLQGSLSGVYSDTLTLPTPPPAGSPAPPDLGSVDLGFQLNQSGSAVSGYIALTTTLVFSREHTITVGETPLDIGPTVQGSFDGVNLSLVSEQFGLQVAGRSVQRQFRLIGAVAADGRTLTGEYRETIWGYTPQPITAIGAFTLQRNGVGPLTSTSPSGGNSKIYLPIITR